MGRKGDPVWERIFESLAPANQSWTKSAPVLFASMPHGFVTNVRGYNAAMQALKASGAFLSQQLGPPEPVEIGICVRSFAKLSPDACAPAAKGESASFCLWRVGVLCVYCLAAEAFMRCLRNILSKSGKNSLRTFPAASTPTCTQNSIALRANLHPPNGT